MAAELKRQNFNVTPEQEARLDTLREGLDAPSVKDAILRAADIVCALLTETSAGGTVQVAGADGRVREIWLHGMAPRQARSYDYLVERPHAWRRQLSVKGRRLLASTVWQDMLANGLSLEDAAASWSLPTAAVREIVRYCEASRDLIEMEAAEERQRLQDAGVDLGPPTPPPCRQTRQGNRQGPGRSRYCSRHRQPRACGRPARGPAHRVNAWRCQPRRTARAARLAGT